MAVEGEVEEGHQGQAPLWVEEGVELVLQKEAEGVGLECFGILAVEVHHPLLLRKKNLSFQILR